MNDQRWKRDRSQPTHHQPQGGGGGIDGSQLPLPPMLPMGSGGGSTGAIRPNSMTERARMAKMPQPETALKCPRCESTNTKFCYFNNYSLSQPRHFCKTCRRYWTRGGALRNVPVGGGCRRNKRSKGRNSRSKSPAVTEGQATAGTSSSSALSSRNIIGRMQNPQQQIPMLPNLHHLSDYNSSDIGLNFGGIQIPSQGVACNGNDIGFQVANGTSNSGSILSSGLVEQWKLQQFPFLSNGLEQVTGLYPFDTEIMEPQSYTIGQLRSKSAALDSEATQFANVKMEDNTQSLNLSRNFLGINSANDHQYWGTNNNAWSDLSGFTSSSTSHLL
ncbi:hypothetical protein KPL71_011366 [Citrus sinensis]|uniref:Uncharacterized protein n=1 Tax=Citrus sinensis TaxID=2711 RepID=A0ACB8L364_CITSI|nr:hypothetical protein KPL71_011366 [Citrus sinensis]